MSASHPSPDAPRCTICGKAATRQDIDGEWWPPCPHAMKFGIHTLASRSSAPSDERSVHPSDAELSRRQRCDARLESDAVPAFDADGESIQYRGPEIPGAALPVPAEEAELAAELDRLIVEMERSVAARRQLSEMESLPEVKAQRARDGRPALRAQPADPEHGARHRRILATEGKRLVALQTVRARLRSPSEIPEAKP